MKAVLAAVVAATVSAGSLRGELGVPSRKEVEVQFESWRRVHGQEYATAEEHVRRLDIFEANNLKILQHNANPTNGVTLAHNKFSALSQDEWRSTYLSLRVPESRATTEFNLDTSVPVEANINWVTAGAVTGVKDQGQCGSCWSFSATGGLEGAYFLKTGTLASFSEQELVSCDKVDGGCNGGWMDDAFTYAQNNGLASEADYPYVSGSGSQPRCTTGKARALAPGAVTGFVDVPANSEAGLQAALAPRPVSVAIEADQTSFQFYSGGILQSGCGQNLDHGVLAVGYLASGTTNYYLVKNSWGSGWGAAGFISIAAGKDLCGIANAASYPTM